MESTCTRAECKQKTVYILPTYLLFKVQAVGHAVFYFVENAIFKFWNKFYFAIKFHLTINKSL